MNVKLAPECPDCGYHYAMRCRCNPALAARVKELEEALLRITRVDYTNARNCARIAEAALNKEPTT